MNEKEMIEHIIEQMEEERCLDKAAAMADMRFAFIKKLCDFFDRCRDVAFASFIVLHCAAEFETGEVLSEVRAHFL